MSRLSNLSSLSREELVLLSRMAEQSERHEEMLEFIKIFISSSATELSSDERNIVSVAFKNVVGTRRNAWRVCNSIAKKEAQRGNEEHKSQALAYKDRVETELRTYCEDILRLIDSHLLVNATSNEGKIFLTKMKGDYYRYICEFAQGDYLELSSNNAKKYYQEAFTMAETTLDATHPSRVGLALNFSVLFYEIFNDHEEAIRVAQKAFEEGIQNLENVTDEQNYKESTMILQLLRDNISLWTADDN